jgi:hypothetical protein
MATAAGIILATGAVTLLNEGLSAPFEQGNTNVLGSINWRVIPATAIAAVIFAGIEQVNGPLGRGLAWVAFTTMLVAPVGAGPSPLVHLADIMGYGGSALSGKVLKKVN